MSVTKEEKRRVISNFSENYPSLKAYTLDKLYVVIGNAVAGFEIFKLPREDKYKVYLVFYPLWKETINECLSAPLILCDIKNEKGRSLSVPYNRHAEYFKEVLECTKLQIPINLDQDLKLKNLFELIDSQFENILVKSNSAEQAKLLEFKLYSALYVGNKNIVLEILNQITIIGQSWDFRLFNIWYGDFDMWKKKLEDTMNRRDDFIIKIKTNRAMENIKMLNFFELV